MSDPNVLNVQGPVRTTARSVWCSPGCHFGWNESEIVHTPDPAEVKRIQEHAVSHPDHIISIRDTRVATVIISVRPTAPTRTLEDVIKEMHS